MKKVNFYSILIFLVALIIITYSAIVSALFVPRLIQFGEFYSIMVVFCSFIFIFIYFLILYWLIIVISPVKMDVDTVEIPENSYAEFMFDLEFMVISNIFLSLLKSYLVPTPIKVLVYKLLGLKIGKNSFVNKVSDPRFVQIGNNTILGEDSVVFCHVFENKKKSVAPIKIGNNVVVGANSVIMPGVTIGDNSIVAAGAIVTKFTHIPSGEIWGGVPARKIKDIQYVH